MVHTRRLSLVALVLMIALAGCGGSQSGQQDTSRGNASPGAAASGAASASQAATAGGTASAAPAGTTPPEESPRPDISPPAIGGSPGPTVAPAASEAATTTGAQPSPSTFDPTRVKLGLEPVAEGMDRPLFVTHASDGTGRIFVVEKGGTIRTLADQQLFLDISDRVNARSSEQGLLGLAFHPQFKENGQLFVYYTDANGNTVVSRFGLTADGRGDPASEQVVLRQEQPAANHNGGMIAFGPDDMLYIGLGDGGGANDQFGNGQNRDTFLGKLLRIDVNQGQPYAIPADNPFVNDSGTRPEIWAYGLRNPWRFSFDRATRDLYIADVGQNRFEWVHVRAAGQQGGENYGWPILEGRTCFRGDGCNREGLTVAVADYPHSQGCSVTGGYVYRGAQYPILQGAYILGDYCSGRIWTMTGQGEQWSLTEMLRSDARISSFGEDEQAELYLTDLASGTVYRVTAQPR